MRGVQGESLFIKVVSLIVIPDLKSQSFQFPHHFFDAPVEEAYARILRNAWMKRFDKLQLLSLSIVKMEAEAIIGFRWPSRLSGLGECLVVGAKQIVNSGSWGA